MRESIRVTLASTAGLFVLAATAGCSLDLGEIPFRCNKNSSPPCPDGYECKYSYCVREGTCPAGVPGCPSSAVCGNGQCETGETPTSCPKDCKTSACRDRLCEAGTGKDGGADQPLADIFSPDKLPPDQLSPDKTPAVGTFGSKCGLTIACGTGLKCLYIYAGAYGFCTKQCFTSGEECLGSPTGTKSYCILTETASGDTYCAFVCKSPLNTWPCPTDLQCDTQENPPGSGQYVCIL